MQDLKAIRFVEGTKISHDYEDRTVRTFSYRELIAANVPAIGIPARQNKLLIVDVDVAGISHKKDGREFWSNFCAEYGIPSTYTVGTPSGGFHFYFRLPESVNPELFNPPGVLAPGIELKWNGWVGAPPSHGYSVVYGNVGMIAELPPSFLAYISQMRSQPKAPTFDVTNPSMPVLEFHRPFTPAQIHELRHKIKWLQTNGTLSREEWRNGLFALNAGIDDPDVLDELICAWTMNRAYVTGDEEEARSIVARAEKHGPIGPGSIFAILRQVAIREGAPAVDSPFTNQEIIDRSKVSWSVSDKGALKIEPSESNAAALIGAMFDEETLYHDTRVDLYIYKGESVSDADLVNTFLPLIQSPAYGLGLEKFRKSAVAGGVEVLMAKRRRDPHREYLLSLKWDGVPRIERFFSHYVGAEDSEYTRKVGMNFWVAMAARGLKPGSKFDSMVVLEGNEGIAKSSLVQAIGGKYTNAPADEKCMKNLDRLREMHQAIIVELPELIGLVGMDSETVKAFLSKSTDHIRSLYARKAMENKRGFVFVGTVNPDSSGTAKYLTRAMGSRRFWPVSIPPHVKSVNLAGIKMDRDQLFAEAILRFNEGYQYWHMPSNLLDPIIESRIVDEPLVAPTREVIEMMPDNFTTLEVYRRLEQSGYVNKGINGQVLGRIEDSLRRLGAKRTGDVWLKKESNYFPSHFLQACMPTTLENLI